MFKCLDRSQLQRFDPEVYEQLPSNGNNKTIRQ